MKPQSKLWSVFETVANTATSFCLSVFIQWLIFPWFGIYVDFATNVYIVLVFMTLSLVRGYFIRRFFNWLGNR